MTSQIHFFSRTSVSATQILKGVTEELEGKTRYRIGLLIVSHDLIRQREWLALQLDNRLVERWFIVAGEGLLAGNTRYQNVNAVVGILFTEAEAGALSQIENHLNGQRYDAALIFEPERHEESKLEEMLPTCSSSTNIIGIQVPKDCPTYIRTGEEVSFQERVGIVFSHPYTAHTATSSWTQLLTPFFSSKLEKPGQLIRLGDNTAVDTLAEITQAQRSPLLIVVCAKSQSAIREEYEWLEANHEVIVTRTLTGIDPERGILQLSSPPREQELLAFATPSKHAGELDLKRRLVALQRAAGGAKPQFGLYFSSPQNTRFADTDCNQDLSLIRRRFENLPLFGVSSPSLFLSHNGSTNWHQYARILCLYFDPS